MRYLYLIVWPLSLVLIASLAGLLMSAIIHYPKQPPKLCIIAVPPKEPPPLPRFLQQFIEPPSVEQPVR